MRRVGIVALVAVLMLGGCLGVERPKPDGPSAPEAGKVRVTWFGQSMFLIENRATAIVIDPYGPDIGYILPHVSADIVLISNGAYRRARSVPIGGNPSVVDQVGEVYVGNFAVVGIPSFADAHAKGPNAIYYWKMEGVSFAHMGDFSQRTLSGQQEGLLRNVDVLMMPVGGRTTYDARVATRITRLINPKVVIPMDYRTPAVVVDLAPVETFSARFASIKRVGDSVELSKRELPAQTEVWVMKYKQP